MVDWENIQEPVFLKGNPDIAYRDPCGHFHDGVFRVWHTEIHGEAGGDWYAVTAVTESRDLVAWSNPRVVTPIDKRLNYSSPGKVIRFGGKWVMCLQTYPAAQGGKFGDASSRVFTMESDDLETWSDPELIRVKGPDSAREDMGRMIDPYLVEDKEEAENPSEDKE